MLDGHAVVYSEDAFGSIEGKTAHGLVRRTSRYRIVAVIDSTLTGRDAGGFLDGKPNGIHIVANLTQARRLDPKLSHFVVGVAPVGGRLSMALRVAIRDALLAGLNVDCGLHDFLSEDPEFRSLAKEQGLTLRDVRKPPPREQLHSFSGKIDEVTSRRIAVLGTDSAVGKRTTAWLLVDAFRDLGHSAELIGTGQTAWLQGARYGIRKDALISDFIGGEMEHAIWLAWKEQNPDFIVIEGQGSLLNPAFTAGLKTLAVARPHVVVLQHAPGRPHYDGFPNHPIHSVDRYIEAIRVLSDKPVVAVTINHENLPTESIRRVCAELETRLGIPVVDVLKDGARRVAEACRP